MAKCSMEMEGPRDSKMGLHWHFAAGMGRKGREQLRRCECGGAMKEFPLAASALGSSGAFQ